MSTLDENLIHTLKKEIADLQAKLDAKCKTIEVYDAVTNALPGYQKVAIAHAHIAATKGASSEELAALVGRHRAVGEADLVGMEVVQRRLDDLADRAFGERLVASPHLLRHARDDLRPGRDDQIGVERYLVMSGHGGLSLP